MNTEVILKENVPSLGYVGDKVTVRGGYARNFLIPRGIAISASARNQKQLKHLLTGIVAKKTKLKTEAEELSKKLQGLALSFTLKSGEAGKAFGSVTVRDILASLKAQGFELDRKQVKVADTMKKAGNYTVSVKLHAEVTAEVPVVLIMEAKAPEADAGAARAAKGKGRAAKPKKGSAEGEVAASGEGEAVAADAVEAKTDAPAEKKARKPKAGKSEAKTEAKE